MITTMNPPLLSLFKIRVSEVGDSKIYNFNFPPVAISLTTIDWKIHLNQSVATSKVGDVMVSRKYHQRTKEWNSRVVKVKKKYETVYSNAHGQDSDS